MSQSPPVIIEIIYTGYGYNFVFLSEVSSMGHLTIINTTKSNIKYLCAKSLSALVCNQNKQSNKLQLESDLRLQHNSNTNQNITNFIKIKHHQPSH